MGQAQSMSLTAEQQETLAQRYGKENTESVRKEAFAIFKDLDISLDGKLSKVEFISSLGMLGTENSILSNLLFDAIDSDRSGEIDFYEFLQFLLTVSVGTKEEKLAFGFSLIDLDKNGEISKEEIITFIQTLFSVLTSYKLKVPHLETYCENLMKMWDFNSDGKITWNEYRDGCMQHEGYIKNLGALNVVLSKTVKKIGKKVFLGQVKWDFMLSVMFGLQLSVENLPPLSEEDLKEEDYTKEEIFQFPNHEEEVRMHSYAPELFRRIRLQCGITDEDYANSLGVTQVLGSFLMGDLGGLSELMSEGKSGSFFYFSSDLRFLVKTVSSPEKRTLQKMLKNYSDYLAAHKDTLLTKICGLYKLEISGVTSRFIVMANVFPPGVAIQRRYDLKGSTVGRTVGSDLNKPGIILKDLDFLKTNTKIKLPPKYAQPLINQIEQDSKFLEANGIIDYSFLIGVHEPKSSGNSDNQIGKRKSLLSFVFKDQSQEDREKRLSQEAEFLKKKTVVGGSLFQSHEGGLECLSLSQEAHYDVPLVISVGIIDILIEYEASKHAEHTLKSMVYDGSKISVCPPSEYGPRFREFLKKGIQEVRTQK